MSEVIKIVCLSATPSDTGMTGAGRERREIFERIEEGSDRASFQLFK